MIKTPSWLKQFSQTVQKIFIFKNFFSPNAGQASCSSSAVMKTVVIFTYIVKSVYNHHHRSPSAASSFFTVLPLVCLLNIVCLCFTVFPSLDIICDYLTFVTFFFINKDGRGNLWQMSLLTFPSLSNFVFFSLFLNTSFLPHVLVSKECGMKVRLSLLFKKNTKMADMMANIESAGDRKKSFARIVFG